MVLGHKMKAIYSSGQQITNKQPYLNSDEPYKDEHKSTTAPLLTWSQTYI